MSDEETFGEVDENSKALLQWIVQMAMTPSPGPNTGLGLMRCRAFGVEADAVIVGESIGGGGWSCSVVALIVNETVMEQVTMPGSYTLIPPAPEVEG